jgi:hypothetical protein
VILFDIPRVDLVSLGQLKHAGVTSFSCEPSSVAGNSYANPRIASGTSVTHRISAPHGKGTAVTAITPIDGQRIVVRRIADQLSPPAP